eukprot:3649234-Rhodomonas_salina.1
MNESLASRKRHQDRAKAVALQTLKQLNAHGSVSTERKQFISIYLTKRMVAYAIFVCLFTMLAFGDIQKLSPGPTNFHIWQADNLLDESYGEDGGVPNMFADVGDADGIWEFVQGPMSEALWPMDSPDGAIDTHAYLLGAVRFEQRRRVMQDCTLSPGMGFVSMPKLRQLSCFSSQQDKSSFGASGHEFRFDAKAGLHVTDVPAGNVSQAVAAIEEMVAGEWFDERTDWMQIRFSVYNPRLDVLVYNRLQFRNQMAGGVTASSEM